MSDHSRPFEARSSHIVWSCPWYRVRQDEIIAPNGVPGLYNIIEKADAVWIIPRSDDGRVALIYQYRYTVDDWCWEIPAGSVEPGRSLEETARDELRQEVGGEARSLEYIGRFYPANGICSEAGHIFLATGLTFGPTQHEPAEVMQVHLKPVGEVLGMARAGQISDGPTALALLLCADRLQAGPAGV